MRLVFLGGAESIGASSTLVEIDDVRLVVDCGIRMKGSGPERLPDLSPLEETGPPHAILVTHAHLDHIGALPVLHQRFPDVPIFATPPTIALTRIQLLDSLRIMREESSVDGELPLYSEHAVESLLARMVPTRPLEPFRAVPHGRRSTDIDGDGPEFTFFPAGHIIGAVAIGVTSREGRLFLSGDVSVDSQRTIPGMRTPRFRADVAVFESTYGNRLHANRSAEEARLVAKVRDVIEARGKILIPAFAIGRAQEVILVLLRAQLQRELPEFPIFVDGMIRRTCSVYAAHPSYLHANLRKRIERYGDPFFGVLDTVRPVKERGDRPRIVEGEPCAIVSSSGMLSGGPSPWYARALSGDARNLIAVTGYQDEEAPGRRLLEVARGERETLSLDGQDVKPACRVETYALSGHASGPQIASLAREIGAADVLLVHGDRDARREVSDLMLQERLGRVHLPSHGVPIDPVGRRRRFSTVEAARVPGRRFVATGILGAKSRDVAAVAAATGALLELSTHIRERYREGTTFSVDELWAIAFGADRPRSDALEAFDSALRDSVAFEPHPQRLFLFRAIDPSSRVDDASSDPEHPQAMMERIDAVVPSDAKLLRKSYQPGERHMTLVFAFPDVAAPRYRERIDGVFRGTTWTWDVHPLANPSELQRAISDALPESARLTKTPSLQIEDRSVVLAIERDPNDSNEAARRAWSDAVERIRRETGFVVEYRTTGPTPVARVARDAVGRLEINLAYSTIREAFEGKAHRPYKMGKKPGAPGESSYVELTFISPEVGERFAEMLAELAEEIGWDLRVSQRVNMAGILDVARSVLEGVDVAKGPSFDAARRIVRVTLRRSPPEEEWTRLREEVHERTGCGLESRGP